MRANHAITAVLLASVATLSAARANAQATATGFALNQFSPSERGSEWFSEDSLDLRGDPGAAIGLVGELALRPLVIYNPDGSTRAVPVRDQLILHPGASVTLFGRLRIGLDVPVAVYQAGTSGEVDGVAYPAVTSGGVGDLRVGADVRLFGRYGGPVSVALGAQLFVPSGNSAQYLGDNSFHAVLPRALVAGRDRMVCLRGTPGVSLPRARHHVRRRRGGERRHLRRQRRGARRGRQGSSPDRSSTARRASREARSTSRPRPWSCCWERTTSSASSVRIGAGVAPGLTRAYGEPAVRLLAGLEWVSSPPAPAPPDRDHDGILDADDACPDVPGVRHRRSQDQRLPARSRPRRHPRRRRRLPRRAGRQDRRPQDQRLPARSRPRRHPRRRRRLPRRPGRQDRRSEDQRLPSGSRPRRHPRRRRRLPRRPRRQDRRPQDQRLPARSRSRQGRHPQRAGRLPRRRRPAEPESEEERLPGRRGGRQANRHPRAGEVRHRQRRHLAREQRDPHRRARRPRRRTRRSSTCASRATPTTWARRR